MSNEITPPEAARYLKRASYLKLDLPTFIVLTKKPQDPASKAAFLEFYGDALYLPSPESLLAELSSVPAFLQFRNQKKEDDKGAADDPLFNRKVASEFVGKMLELLGISSEVDDKLNVYISKNELMKIRTHSEVEVKDLYSLITRSGSGPVRRGNTTQWG